MFLRSYPDAIGHELERSWIQNLQDSLGDSYESQISLHEKRFVVHAERHQNEIVILVSLIGLDHGAQTTPVTFSVSLDLDQKQESDSEKEKLKHRLQVATDYLDLLVNDFFEQQDWDGHCPHWAQTEHRGETFYSRISRENIELTLLANRILEQAE